MHGCITPGRSPLRPSRLAAKATSDRIERLWCTWEVPLPFFCTSSSGAAVNAPGVATPKERSSVLW